MSNTESPETSQERRTFQTNDHGIRIALLEQAMRNITIELHAINSNISRLIWIAIAALGAAAMQFVLKGGLHAL